MLTAAASVVYSSSHLIVFEARALVHTFPDFNAGAYTVDIADVAMSIIFREYSQH